MKRTNYVALMPVRFRVGAGIFCLFLWTGMVFAGYYYSSQEPEPVFIEDTEEAAKPEVTVTDEFCSEDVWENILEGDSSSIEGTSFSSNASSISCEVHYLIDMQDQPGVEDLEMKIELVGRDAEVWGSWAVFDEDSSCAVTSGSLLSLGPSAIEFPRDSEVCVSDRMFPQGSVVLLSSFSFENWMMYAKLSVDDASGDLADVDPTVIEEVSDDFVSESLRSIHRYDYAD